MSIYKIHETNMERVQEKLQKIQNKCNKYNCTFNFAIVGEEFKEKEVTDDFGNKRKIYDRFVLCDVSGIAKINDWEFIATIQHNYSEISYTFKNIIKTYNDNITIPAEYRSNEPKCDHCHSNRGKMRKDTYLVRNTITEEWKQVGSSCLADFLGVDAEDYARYMSYFDELATWESKETGGHREFYLDKNEYLLHVVENIRLFGYVSKKMCLAAEEEGRYIGLTTSQRAWTMMFPTRIDKEIIAEAIDKGYDINYAGNQEKVNEYIEWIASQNYSDDNTFMLNLQSLATEKRISYRNVAILSALPVCYGKAMGRIVAKQEKENRLSTLQFVGNVGEKFSDWKLTVDAVFSFDSKFGMVYINKFRDNDGNTIVWQTNKGFDVGATLKLKGTIKEHSEYKGEKQTEITRCRIVD